MKTVIGARLSLIWTATLAALALQLAQDSGWWTLWCLGTGVVALLTIDLFKWLRPIPSAWGFAPILIAALYCLGEWQWNGLTSLTAANACVHFILLCQTAAIFSDLAGPQVGMSLAGSVVLLLVAVKRQPSSWHLPLLALLLAAGTAGLIFRAVLIREREFQAQLLRGRSAGVAGFVPADRRFPGRIAYVTLLLTMCATAFGLFAFFFFPRVTFASGEAANASKEPPLESIKAGMYPHGHDSEDPLASGTKPGGGGPGGGGGGGVSGWERDISLKNYGKILKEPGVAYHLTREKIDASKPLPGGYIYLRGTTLSHYEGGLWRNERRSMKAALSRKPDDPRWYRLDFEKDKNQLLGAGVSELLTIQQPEHTPIPATPQTLFIPGAADGLESTLPSRPERDSDGSVLLLSVAASNYRWLTQIGSPGLRSEDTTACLHPYLTMTGVDIELRPALLELAGIAKGNARTDQGKALAILQFLRQTGGYSYTLDLPKTPETYPDPIEYFLLESKRGHCACFATGYIMLARLNNIACRLATGFAVRVNQDQTTADVLNSDAHAWVEVYLADRGWVTLDPTPAGANAIALAAANADGNAAGNAQPKPGDAPKPGDPPIPGGTNQAPEPEKDPITTYGPESQSALYGSLQGLLGAHLPGVPIPLWVVLVLSLLAVLAWRLRHWWLRRDEDELAFGDSGRPTGNKIAFYRRMLAIMKSRGYVRRANQSATEFAAQLARRGDPGAKAVIVITNVYLLMRFGALPEVERREAWKRFRPTVEDKLKDLELLRAVEKAGTSEDSNGGNPTSAAPAVG